SYGSADKVYFSLRRGSPLLMNPAKLDARYGLMMTEADVLEPTGGVPAIYIPGEAMGLLTERVGAGYLHGQPDDLDGMDLMYPASAPVEANGQATVHQGDQVVYYLIYFNIFAGSYTPRSYGIFIYPFHGQVALNAITEKLTY